MSTDLIALVIFLGCLGGIILFAYFAGKKVTVADQKLKEAAATVEEAREVEHYAETREQQAENTAELLARVHALPHGPERADLVRRMLRRNVSAFGPDKNPPTPPAS